ncbi:hypothetical protein I6A84_22995 [Frankia sp. CNm7]|uniref:DUF3592 domain-containing protein n=1 Tax=Frankia nepalensis TaxID=1836974 RepID=A0A937UNS0_9ACTN|nr:hypothetical protein [Frankia nepalensis]MBL7502645.1 hypothetical protein [Frankia nepalensis]MBL7514857.1 hypothetical protein [Frankia nepalensis]MBL7520874.1 hypothetical protein [Frankia nepalensis]MBL7626535.1 hypothetical protein [Frankia nepalensis]
MAMRRGSRSRDRRTIQRYDRGVLWTHYERPFRVPRKIALLIVVNGACLLAVLAGAVLLNEILKLRSDGVRTYGTSVRADSSTYTSYHSDGTTSMETKSYTDVSYVDNHGNRHLATVLDFHEVGERVLLVYHDGRPEMAIPVSQTSGYWIASSITIMVSGIGIAIAANRKIARHWYL